MSGRVLALSHCPTLLGVGTMGQGTRETGRTSWDTWDKWDKGTDGMGGLVSAGRARISPERGD